MDQPKESVVLHQELIKGIVEEVFQIVGLNVGKALECMPSLTTSMTN